MRRARPAPVVAPLRPVPAGRGGGRSGASLVELCVAMLLLAIVFTGWVRMNNIQAVNKESLRYAAIEKAAGMLEAVDAARLDEEGLLFEDEYVAIEPNGDVRSCSVEEMHPLFDGAPVPGYRCHVEGATSPEAKTWDASGLWLAMELFDRHGPAAAGHVETPFVTLRLFCTR